MNYFARDQCTLKGGGFEVSDIFGSLFLRVPLHFPILLQNKRGHNGKNYITHQPLDQVWKAGIKTLVNSLITF